MSAELVQLIQNTDIIQDQDRRFLLANITKFNPIESLKIKNALITGTSSILLEIISDMQSPVVAAEKKQLQKKDKKILNYSILTQPNYLGADVPKAVSIDDVPPLQNLLDFHHPSQLSLLSPDHVSFGINDSSEQIIRNFLDSLEKILGKIKDVQTKRSYFMNFLQSALFSNYMNTGLTALRHPEIEPAKVILNTLHQINTSYLNNNQFQYAALICNQVRSLCAL